MKNKKGRGGAISIFLVLAIVALVAIAGGYYLAKLNNGPADDAGTRDSGFSTSDDATESDNYATDNLTTDNESANNPNTQSAAADDSPPDQGAPAKYSGQIIAGSVSPLLDFNKSDYEIARQTDKLIVLYFFANWCPICKQEVEQSLYPTFRKIANENVVGFRVNFNDNQTDSDEKALAKEFGVVYQHTKVFVKNNTRVLKSLEAWTEDRYLEEIERAVNK